MCRGLSSLAAQSEGEVELRKTKGRRGGSVVCIAGLADARSWVLSQHCKRCSFSCLAFHSLGGAVEAQADIQHRKGKGFGSDKETH